MNIQNKCCSERVISETPCRPQPCRPDPCGCKGFIGTECVIYDGKGFRVINLPKGSTLQDILEWVDNQLFKMINDVLTFRNLGDGVKVYKARSADGYYDFRSLKSSNTKTADFTQLDEVINLEVFEPLLKYETGGNIIMYTKSKAGVELEICRIKISDIAGDDIHISNITTSDGNLVFTYNKTKSPITIPIARFLSDYFGTSLELQGTVLKLKRSGGDLSVDLASLAVDTYTTALTLNQRTLVLKQNNGRQDLTVDLAALVSPAAVDTYVTGFSLSGNVITLSQNNGKQPITIDLSSISINGDKHVTGVSFDGQTYTLVITRNGLPNIEVNLSALKPVNSDFTEDKQDKPSFVKNKNRYKDITTDYTINSLDNNINIYIKNEARNITITVPNALSLTANLETNNAFFTSFTQVGTGTVTFVGQTLIPTGKKAVIEGQGHVAAVEATRDTTFVYGNLKQA